MKKIPLLAALAPTLLLLCGLSACETAQEAPGEDVTTIALSDSGIQVDGVAAGADTQAAVHIGNSIIYYQDGTDDTYGEGTADEMHSEAEAAAHTVVAITQPGTYRLTGTLSKGQIFVDLGEEARTDPQAVVTLILQDADITCTVAPAVFFYRVYECDTNWVAYDEGEQEEYEASAVVDTTGAGANVILAAGSENHVTGSHVARIYREGTTKKLHKYDGAFYSRMSMNISGMDGDDTGVLNIVADNEGLGSELHLSINGGTINIESQDDGINTNEDGVSVTTINGGFLTVNAGLGAEGDGIDSNGYLTINGGEIWTMANQSSPDGGIDADMPILINGGTLYAFGTRNDAADSASAQPYLELSFAATLPAGSVITLEDDQGAEIMRAVTRKQCQSLTFTAPTLQEDTAYALYVDGVQQQYTGNRSGMMGGHGGAGGGQRPQGTEPPDGFEPGQRPDGGAAPSGQGGGTADEAGSGEGSVDFVLTSSVHTFSGVSDSPDGSGKARVRFTVNGGAGIASVSSGETVILSQVQADASDLADSDIQITITDVPSEHYAETCLLSDGAEALAGLLPTEDGVYRLTVAVVGGNDAYTGVGQWQFTIGTPA